MSICCTLWNSFLSLTFPTTLNACFLCTMVFVCYMKNPCTAVSSYILSDNTRKLSALQFLEYHPCANGWKHQLFQVLQMFCIILNRIEAQRQITGHQTRQNYPSWSYILTEILVVSIGTVVMKELNDSDRIFILKGIIKFINIQHLCRIENHKYRFSLLWLWFWVLSIQNNDIVLYNLIYECECTLAAV